MKAARGTVRGPRIGVKLAPPSKVCVALGCSNPTAKRCDYFCTLHCACRAARTFMDRIERALKGGAS